MRWLSRHAFLVIVAAAVLVAAGAVMVGGGERPDVVIISINSLRADHLSCYGYHRNTTPAICSIAEDGIMYTKAYSQARWTVPSAASIHSGLYPQVTGIEADVTGLERPMLTEVTTLAERLRTAGYATHLFRQGFEDGRVTYPVGSNLRQGFDTAWNSVPPEQYDVIFPEWLSDEQPQFFYAMTMATHRPYDREGRYVDGYNGTLTRIPLAPDYTRIEYDRGRGYIIRRNGTIIHLDERGIQYMINRYDSTVRRVDAEIRELVEVLKESGWYEDSLIIVTAPHGERLGEVWPKPAGRIFGKSFDRQVTLHVPLIVKPPGGGGGRVVDDLVELIDIYPTVMDVVGVEGPWYLQGDSLIPPYKGGQYIFSGKGHVRNRSWGLYTRDAKGYASPTLYNLSLPPSERQNVASKYPAVTDDLRARLSLMKDRNRLLRARITS